MKTFQELIEAVELLFSVKFTQKLNYPDLGLNLWSAPYLIGEISLGESRYKDYTTYIFMTHMGTHRLVSRYYTDLNQMFAGIKLYKPDGNPIV